MSEYFPKSFKSFGGNIKVKVDLSKLIFLTPVENRIPIVSNFVKKQIMTQKLVKLKRNLLIIITMNILQLLNLIS